jgi:signal transduction histidine kinase
VQVRTAQFPEKSHETRATRALSGTSTVQLVADDAELRARLRRLLAPHYAVQIATDGRRALQMLLAQPPAIVISAMTLPDVDGVGLVERIRGDRRSRDIPVILVCTQADRVAALRAVDLGADDVIVKPFVGCELLARVRATVHAARLRALEEHELHALLDDLKAAHQRVAVTAAAERRRIERDLHDGAQQRLMALRLELGLLAERVADGEEVVTRGHLDRLRGEVDEALGELRDLAHGLHPPLLASDGLYAALSAAARRGHVPVELEGADLGRFAPAVESATYFCCLEALQNVAKHAGSDARAAIRLQARHGELTFSVTDDGCGFERPGDEGHGLTNLRNRLGALGGHAEITSIPGRGTTVLGRVPLTPAASILRADVGTTSPGGAGLHLT